MYILGRLPEAITCFEQAIQMQPNSAEAHNNLGNALTRAGKLPEAIKEFRTRLSLNPDDPFTLQQFE